MRYLYDRSDSVSRIARRERKSRQWVNSNRAPRPQPEIDSDGYPTAKTLRTIRQWQITSNFAVQDLLSYCKDVWAYPDYFGSQKGGKGRKKWIGVSTGGWSGNESVVTAMQQNRMFWVFCWLESRRGGHYRFLTSPMKED